MKQSNQYSSSYGVIEILKLLWMCSIYLFDGIPATAANEMLENLRRLRETQGMQLLNKGRGKRTVEILFYYVLKENKGPANVSFYHIVR